MFHEAPAFFAADPSRHDTLLTLILLGIWVWLPICLFYLTKIAKDALQEFACLFYADAEDAEQCEHCEQAAPITLDKTPSPPDARSFKDAFTEAFNPTPI